MTNYAVTWSIDVEADSPQQAAEAAMEVMLAPSFDTAVFRVTNEEIKAVTYGTEADDFVLAEVPYPADWRSSEALRDLIIQAELAAEGDSNDAEIDNLREALYLASCRWPEIADGT